MLWGLVPSRLEHRFRVDDGTSCLGRLAEDGRIRRVDQVTGKLNEAE